MVRNVSYFEVCIKQHFPENKKVTKYCNEVKIFPLESWVILQGDSLLHQNSAENIKLCCLLRSHQSLLIGGAGCDLRISDPSILHTQREGAVGEGGDHWGGEQGHNLRVSGDQEEEESCQDQHPG